MSARANGVWASGDRSTVWSRRYEKVLPDGSTEVWIVEKIELLDKKTKQFRKTDFTTIVISQDIPLFNRKTMEYVCHTEYYTFAQSWHGGPSARYDALGGFFTGQYAECWEESANKNIKYLEKEKFRLVSQS